jgi:hypothetical protein
MTFTERLSVFFSHGVPVEFTGAPAGLKGNLDVADEVVAARDGLAGVIGTTRVVTTEYAVAALRVGRRDHRRRRGLHGAASRARRRRRDRSRLPRGRLTVADSILERIALRMKADLEAGGQAVGAHGPSVAHEADRPGRAPGRRAVSPDGERAAEGRRVGPAVRARRDVRGGAAHGGNPPDKELDPYRTWAIKQLVGDQTMGGIAKSVEYLGGEWQAVASNKVLGAVRLQFHVKYQARAVDPELQ